MAGVAAKTHAPAEETKRRILVVHNAYQQRGGEDSVMEAEVDLLRRHGHAVALLGRHNDEIADMGRLALAGETLWSRRSAREFDALAVSFRPDVVHVHNTFPLVSPSIYWAADRHRIPVVQTLHNFRLFCPQAMLLRNGAVCEDCLGKLPWRGMVRGCYRDSVAQSSVLGGMLAVHRLLGTYRRRVTRYVALNDFCRKRFIAGGLPAESIVVKPNFVDLPSPAPGLRQGGLFVGRLSPEKGIAVLAQALAQLATPVVLNVLGSGPLVDTLAGCPGVTLHGQQSLGTITDAMGRASYLVMPSIWYENFPRTLVEAFACGLPVIASRLGAMADLVAHRRTGLLFEPGNPAALADAIRWAEENPAAMRVMGANARAEYEGNYTPEINLRQLLAIYDDAAASRHGNS